MYQNKSIDKIQCELKSMNKKEKEPDRWWRELGGGGEQPRTGGNDRNRCS
jgi:hypothetical protein